MLVPVSLPVTPPFPVFPSTALMNFLENSPISALIKRVLIAFGNLTVKDLKADY